MEQESPDQSLASRNSRTKRKRPLALAACSRCRRLKKRCDTVRPVCGTCQHVRAPCQYETNDTNESRFQAVRRHQQDAQSFQQTVNESLVWLQSQDPETVIACLQRLKDVDVANVARELCSIVADRRAERISPRISVQNMPLASSLSLHESFDPELSIQHPMTYPWLLDGGSQRGESTARALGVAPQLIALEAVSSVPWSYLPDRTLAGSAVRPNTPSIHLPSAVGSYDERLRLLRIDYWTTVPVPSELAAQVLSTYFRVEHPIYSFFDADLFLEDLLANEIQYCSPLLVNALLFWAGCTFRPVHPAISDYIEGFLETAQSLLLAEQNVNTGLNVAALMILALGSICDGKDSLGRKCMIAGIKMAEAMHLIGEERYTIDQYVGLSPRMLSTLVHAAWGAFNFSTVYLLHFHDASSGTYTKCPPLLPQPGRRVIPAAIPSRSAQSSPLLDLSTVSSFPFFCDFWCIAHQVGSVYYNSTASIHQRVPLAFVQSKLYSLLQWAAELPRELGRRAGMAHNVAEMHICYHATIMDLLRPFLFQEHSIFMSPTEPHRPETIYDLSYRHLKDLTWYYHASFAGTAELHTISWVHGPLYVAPTILHHDKSANWKEDFLHCIEACSGLLQSHRMMDAVMRAFLGMAISEGILTVAQARQCFEGLGLTNAHEPVALETKFVVDQDLAIEDRAASVGSVLAQQFAETLLFEHIADTG